MIPNPILKVLFTLQKHKVKALLIGGQACIIYGAVEFSKDSDFVILLSSANLKRLEKALKELNAGQIYVPSLSEEFLFKGHACHFRARVSGAKGIRIDIMSKMRGCDSFEKLWKRRKRVRIGRRIINVINLKDLVQSKKTQRDKDWLMLKRLIEIDILNTQQPAFDRIKWWFLECRTPELLIKLSGKYPYIAKECSKKRSLLKYAITESQEEVYTSLLKEEEIERNKDRLYWAPLRKELEQLRHKSLLTGQ